MIIDEKLNFFLQCSFSLLFADWGNLSLWRNNQVQIIKYKFLQNKNGYLNIEKQLWKTLASDNVITHDESWQPSQEAWLPSRQYGVMISILPNHCKIAVECE